MYSKMSLFMTLIGVWLHRSCSPPGLSDSIVAAVPLFSLFWPVCCVWEVPCYNSLSIGRYTVTFGKSEAGCAMWVCGNMAVIPIIWEKSWCGGACISCSCPSRPMWRIIGGGWSERCLTLVCFALSAFPWWKNFSSRIRRNMLNIERIQGFFYKYI